MKLSRPIAGCATACLLALAGAAPAVAQGVRSFCVAAKQALGNDGGLRAAAQTVFPTADFASRDDECLYPEKVLRYADADVLLVVGGKPGEACHGCSANLSAYVLRRLPGRSILVARFVDFATSGTFGDPGRIDAVQLDGHDAFAIQAGGMFQGYTVSTLTLFVFKAGRLVELKPSLPLVADNGGAMTDERKAVSVEGSWHVESGQPAVVTITYRVRAHGRERRAGAQWLVQGDTLSLTSGRVPPEYEAAGGG